MARKDGELKAISRANARLRRENQRLRNSLEYKNNNISLLNVINSNMRAALRTNETYYVILTAVTANVGLGFNRGMLFIRDTAAKKIRGAMAISPDDRRQMKRFYEEAAEKRFDFSFYIEQFYAQNLQVSNKLNSAIALMSCSEDHDNVLTRALETGEVTIYPKTTKKDFRGLEGLRKMLKKEFVVAPIRAKDEPIGVLIADHHFTDVEIDQNSRVALATLCEFAASIILIARKYEETEALSVVDELTKLYNYRYFEKKIRDEVHRGKRYNRIFSIILLDIDYFKHFNDKNGHLTGNKALMDLASILKTSIRSVDFSARYGGEEFVLVLPETDKRGAECMAAKLLDRVREHAFLGGDNQPGKRLTISGGIAAYPEDGADHEAILKKADHLLYMAKASGKDQILS